MMDGSAVPSRKKPKLSPHPTPACPLARSPARAPLGSRDLDIGSPKRSPTSLFRPRRIYKNGRSNALHNRGSCYVRARYARTRGSVNPQPDHDGKLRQATKVKALGRCSLASLSKEEEGKKKNNREPSFNHRVKICS